MVVRSRAHEGGKMLKVREGRRTGHVSVAGTPQELPGRNREPAAGTKSGGRAVPSMFHHGASMVSCASGEWMLLESDAKAAGATVKEGIRAMPNRAKAIRVFFMRNS